MLWGCIISGVAYLVGLDTLLDHEAELVTFTERWMNITVKVL